ncbi:hypothetical protein L9F63_011861, partial [Diploptera punctata]
DGRFARDCVWHPQGLSQAAVVAVVRLRVASSRDCVLHPQGLSQVAVSLAKRRRTTSRQPLTMPDAVSGETSGNNKPHDHGLQPENLHQDHHSNSGRENL